MGKNKKRDLDTDLASEKRQIEEPLSKQSTLAFSGGDKPLKYGSPSLDKFGAEPSIFNWNINGLNAVINSGKLTDFISDFSPDVLCLNETKCDADKLAKQQFWQEFPGYESYWNCCKIKKGYSGVAVLTKVKPVSVVFGIGDSAHD